MVKTCVVSIMLFAEPMIQLLAVQLLMVAELHENITAMRYMYMYMTVMDCMLTSTCWSGCFFAGTYMAASAIGHKLF